MAETQQNFPNGTTDPEATLVQPRFDEAESQIAQPVVPLSREPLRRARSRLPVALVLVSALLGGLVSVLAYRLYQRPSAPTQPAAEQQTATQPATTQPAPQSSPTPELTAAAAAPEEPAPRADVETATAPTKREEDTTAAAAAPAEKAARVAEKKRDEEGKGREENKARDDRRRDDEPRAARVAEPRARRVDVIPSYPDDGVVDERDTRRVGATDYQFPNDRREGRRGRRPKRRNIDRIRDIFGAPPPA
jgi:hypothetical protein